MKDWRFWLGRHLIHLGLRVMPHGRCRRELHEILTVWGMKVESTVAAHHAVARKPSPER